MAVNSVLQTVAGGLQLASAFSGIPYASLAGTLLSGILDAVQQIDVHKRKCTLLAEKCNLLQTTLDENESRLVGTELQGPADQMLDTLQRVQRHTGKYRGYSKVKSFLKLGDIDKGLDKCIADLDNVISMFGLNANIAIHNVQRETLDTLRSSSSNTEELLYQILTNQEAMRDIVRMEREGNPVAERIMEAGQLRMRELHSTGPYFSPRPSYQQNIVFSQPQELLIAERMTSPSPPPIARPLQERGETYQQIERGLYELHRLTGVPPTVKILDGEVRKLGDLAVTGGTFSDVWEGTWMGWERVALKALRNIKASDQKAKKRFETEIHVWDKLKHPHILSFYGIVTNLGPIHMVSPWQTFGNVLEYVQAHPSANRIHLLSGAAKGIEYLHDCRIVHGNLKCANILVSEQHEARICDFGMSAVIEEVTEKSASATLTAAGSARWLAPELIEGSSSSPTFFADIYSFAMAILELLTGKHPFSEVKRDASVIHRIVVLKRMPQRPDFPEVAMWLTDELWDLMQHCWVSEATARPSMKFVSARISSIEQSLSISRRAQ